MADQRLRYVIEFDNKGAVTAIDKVKDSEDKMGKAGEDAGGRASNGIKKMTESMTASIAKGGLLVSVIERMAEKAKDYFKEAMLEAAQNEKSEVILRKLAETHRMNAGAVMERVKAVEHLGYLDEDAMSLVGKMIHANIDLSKATEIATAAKNAGAFADMKSTDALEVMLFAAEAGYGRPLRQMNIFVDLAKKITEEQKRLGYEMTDSEKRTFALNEIMKEAANLNGTWEAKMGTTAGRMESLSRAATQLREDIGKEFQRDLDNIVTSFKGLAQWAGENKDVLASVIKYTVEFAGVLATYKLAEKIWEVVIAMRALSAASLLSVPGLIGAGIAATGFAAYNFHQDQEKYWADQESAMKAESIRAALGKGQNVAQLKKAGFSEEEINRAVMGNRGGEQPEWGKTGITVKGFERPGESTDHKLLKNPAAEEAEKKAHEILVDAQKAEFEGLGKIVMEYKVYQVEVGKTAKARLDLAKAFEISIKKEAEKELLKNSREHLKTLEEEGKQAVENLSNKYKERIGYRGETAQMDLDNIDHQNEVWREEAANERDAKLRGLQAIHADSMKAQVFLEQQKAAVEIEYFETEANLHKEAIQQRLERELDYLNDLRVMYPENAKDIDARIAAVAEKSANETKDVDRKKTADISSQRDQAAIRSAELVRNRMQQQFDTLKKSAGDVFDALLTKSSNVFSAIGNAFKTAILTAIKEIVTSRVAAMLMQMFYGQKVTFTGNGGMVANTPVFGGGSGGGLFGGGGLASLAGIAGMGGGNGAPVTTPPFVGGGQGAAGGVGGTGAAGTGAGGASGGGGLLGMLKGNLSGLKSLFGFGNISKDSQGGMWSTVGNQSISIDSFGGKLQALGKSDAAALGGAMLAIDGLRRGGVLGTAESTAGGAAVGYKFGGPLGAAIGAGVGFLAGLGRTLFGGKSDDQEVRDRVKTIYGVDIQDKGVRSQILQMAKQSFGGSIDTAIRSAEVRKLIENYAMATSQTYKGPSAEARSVSLAQTGGSMYQVQSYNSAGAALPSLGGSLPTLGAVTSTGAGPLVVQSLSLSVNGQSASDALEGRVAAVVTPSYVASASQSAQLSNVGRRQAAAAQWEPGALLA